MNENVLHRNRWSEWSGTDLNFLEENYRTMPLSEIACALGRTPGSVRLMAHKLSCQEKAPPRWAPEEDEIIRQHYAAGVGVAFIETLLKEQNTAGDICPGGYVGGDQWQVLA